MVEKNLKMKKEESATKNTENKRDKISGFLHAQK